MHKGESGAPGELRGSFTGSRTGELLINSQVGIFGTGGQPSAGPSRAAALRYEVVEGPATNPLHP